MLPCSQLASLARLEMEVFGSSTLAQELFLPPPQRIACFCSVYPVASASCMRSTSSSDRRRGFSGDRHRAFRTLMSRCRRPPLRSQCGRIALSTYAHPRCYHRTQKRVARRIQSNTRTRRKPERRKRRPTLTPTRRKLTPLILMLGSSSYQLMVKRMVRRRRRRTRRPRRKPAHGRLLTAMFRSGPEYRVSWRINSTQKPRVRVLQSILPKPTRWRCSWHLMKKASSLRHVLFPYPRKWMP